MLSNLKADKEEPDGPRSTSSMDSTTVDDHARINLGERSEGIASAGVGAEGEYREEMLGTTLQGMRAPPQRLRTGRSLLDSADDMAADVGSEASGDETVSQFSGDVEAASPIHAYPRAAGHRPLWVGDRQDSASYQPLPPALVQRQDSAQYQQEQQEVAASLSLAGTSGQGLGAVGRRDSAREMSDESSNPADENPRAFSQGLRSRLGSFGHVAGFSGGVTGNAPRPGARAAFQHWRPLHETGGEASMRASHHEGEGVGPGGFGRVASLEAARRQVLEGFMRSTTMPVIAAAGVRTLDQEPGPRQDSPLGSLDAARRAVFADFAENPLPPERDGLAARPVPGAQGDDTAHNLLSHASFAAEERRLAVRMRSLPTDLRQDSALHTLVHARMAVLSELGGARGGAAAISVPAIDVDPPPLTGMGHSRPESLNVSQPDSGEGPTGALLEARRSVMLDLAVNPAAPPVSASGGSPRSARSSTDGPQLWRNSPMRPIEIARREVRASSATTPRPASASHAFPDSPMHTGALYTRLDFDTPFASAAGFGRSGSGGEASEGPLAHLASSHSDYDSASELEQILD